jgi:hypothetical protein
MPAVCLKGPAGIQRQGPSGDFYTAAAVRTDIFDLPSSFFIHVPAIAPAGVF